MLMRDYPTKIKLLYGAFLVLLGVGGLIAGDYLIVGFLISTSVAYLIDPRRSKTHKTVHLALMILTIIFGCLYFYARIKSVR
jgi:hypothetical protein